MTASERKSAQVNAQTNNWLLWSILGVTDVKTAFTDVYADATTPCPNPPRPLSRRLDGR